jgi:hypothetical protein
MPTIFRREVVGGVGVMGILEGGENVGVGWGLNPHLRSEMWGTRLIAA